MPDILNHTIQAQANSNLTVAQIRIQATVVDSHNQQTVLADFTGANAINFALLVPGFTAADHLELVRLIAQWIILRKAGLS